MAIGERVFRPIRLAWQAPPPLSPNGWGGGGTAPDSSRYAPTDRIAAAARPLRGCAAEGRAAPARHRRRRPPPRLDRTPRLRRAQAGRDQPRLHARPDVAGRSRRAPSLRRRPADRPRRPTRATASFPARPNPGPPAPGGDRRRPLRPARRRWSWRRWASARSCSSAARSVRQRTKDTWGLWRRGVLQPESNVQFGEGGAGTFSDGKLYSQIKRPAASRPQGAGGVRRAPARRRRSSGSPSRTSAPSAW